MDHDSTYRKKMRRREVEGGVRFLTFSCYHRLPLLGNPGIRDVFMRSLMWARPRYGFRLHAWVVMPEHVHLLMLPAAGTTAATVLAALKVSVSKRVIRRWKDLRAPILKRIMVGDRPQFWQDGGGFDRNVRSEAEFQREVRYTHHNPFERGLVAAPEQWAWSSARSWMGLETPWSHDPPSGDARAWGSWKGFV